MNISEMTKSKIRDLIEGFREFDVCGPSDDPDAQTAMVVAHNSIIIKLKYYSESIEHSLLQSKISALCDRLETVYDVYDARSRLEPLLDELEQLIDGSTSSTVHQELEPMERVDLIEKIGCKLRDTMKTPDINIFLAGYDIDFHPEEVASSKRLYVKDILANESERIILKIARDLDLYRDVSLVSTGQIEHIDNEFVKEQLGKCNQKILSNDYDGAITNARTLVEAVCIHILDGLEVKYEHDGNLIKLYKHVSKHLAMEPSLYHSEDLRKITSGFVTVIQGLAGLRNDLSDAHGRDITVYRACKRHAILAVNAAQTISDYLLESYFNLAKSQAMNKLTEGPC